MDCWFKKSRIRTAVLILSVGAGPDDESSTELEDGYS